MIYLNISESEYQDVACSEVAIIHHIPYIYTISEYEDADLSEYLDAAGSNMYYMSSK